MSEQVISPEIDQVLEDMRALSVEAWEACKQAKLELATEKAKHKVELEKVASEQPKAAAVDEALVDDTMRLLSELDFISPGESVKVAAEIKKDPNTALRLVQSLAKISVPAEETGRGVPKQASDATSGSVGQYPADWVEDKLYRIVEEGA